MASRGFIRLVNSEKSEEEPYYGFTEDLLVEACHDGYAGCIMEDLLRIPERMVKLTNAGFASWLLYPGHKPLLDPKKMTLGKFCEECYALQIIREINWYSILEWLQLSKPFKYGLIQVGSVRYGHPFTFEDCTITMRVVDGVHHVELKEVEEATIAEEVRETNLKLKLKRFPFTASGSTITVDFRLAFLEAFWNHHTQIPCDFKATATKNRIDLSPSCYFVRTNTQMVETLFNPGGTASGTFTVQKRGIVFYDGKGEPFVFLSAHPKRGNHFVSCKKGAGGKIQYEETLLDPERQRLSFLETPRSEIREIADTIWKQHCA